MKRIALIGSIALAGCSATNTEQDFLCSAQIGSPCTSIAQADGQGSGTVTRVTEAAEDTALKSLSQDLLALDKGDSLYAGMPDGGHPYETSRYREPEIVGRLWIAPYLDDNALLHESRYVHFVLQDARWVQR